MAKIVTSIPSSTNITYHNNLPGLNEGNYLHLTQLEKDNLTFVPGDYDLEDFTNNGIDPYLKQSDVVPGSANLSYVASPSQGVVISDTGTDATIPIVDFVNAGLISPSDRQLLYNDSSTGVTRFDGLSINVDTTKFNVGIVEGWFVNNYNNPNAPTKIFKSFPATTANIVPNIATQNVSYIAIDINGILQFSSSPFDQAIQRDYCILGVLVHSNRIVINAINNQPVVAIDNGAQLSDLMEAIGFFNISGNVFSPNGANLNINKSFGHVFKQGANFINTNKDPHTLNLAALTAPSNLRYRLQNGTEYVNTAVIDPGFYDNAGVRASVPGTKYTIQRIYLFQSNLVRIQYGQAIYANMADAIQAIATEPFVVEQNILENGLFRGLLILRDNTTDLTDTSKALFIEASKFGSVAGLGSLSTTSLQQAYNNSVTPEIITDSALGAFTVKRGSVADTDNVFETQNGAGVITASIKGNGEILGSNLSGINTGDQDLSGKQDALVSGTNIKTKGGISLLGAGDIPNSVKITTTVSITNTTTTVAGDVQEGKIVKIDNGVNVINYTVNGAINASFIKMGTGAITFVQGSGRTLTGANGTLVLNGAVNSTASIVSDGTVDIVYINNL